jgi:hypothetical protein
MSIGAAKTNSDIANIGNEVGHIDVNIGPRFLNLFSEHLYSSPNKAFEELISNSWDAGAEAVYIGVPEKLSDDGAVVWVLDDGQSMDIGGFQALWSVATSNKRTIPKKNGRQQIGKFGVGKLATYILANQLTYICKAGDGKIRAITMDYRVIDQTAQSTALHVEKLPLAVRELSPEDLIRLLSSTSAGKTALDLINAGIPRLNRAPDYDNEFGAPDDQPTPRPNTWTLAVLSSLKPDGKRLQQGWIKRILKAALPLGTTISVKFNDEVLYSSKSNKEVEAEWILGPGLGIEALTLDDGTEFAVKEIAKPYPRLAISGIGTVTGRARIYKSKISEGKSDQVDASNGFFVNVLGRVIKPEDPYFGLDNLSHSAWSKFRATVRIDGLDARMSVNRESIADSDELNIVRALLKKLFNKARVAHDAATQAGWPDAGAVLTEKWGSVPLEPLRRVVSDRLAGTPAAFVDISNVKDMPSEQQQWRGSSTSDVIRDVAIEEGAKDGRLVKYDLATRRIVINRSHPFVREHGANQEQLRLLRDAAIVELLTDAFMADLGIPDDRLKEISDYRERAYRLVAQVGRKSAAQIAAMLLETTNHIKGFERIVGDALEHIGFSVERLGASGEPEGVATALITAAVGATQDQKRLYRFTYDAKSSVHGKVSTGNIGFAGLARHRDEYMADHALVVAPDYADGALQNEATACKVTPIRAKDLAALVMLTVGYGPLDLSQFRTIFEINNPNQIEQWIQKTEAAHKAQPQLSLDTLIKALEAVTTENPDRPDALSCDLIAEHCRKILGRGTFPTKFEVAKAIRGLALIVPNILRIAEAGFEVTLSAPASKLREALAIQLNNIPMNIKFGIARGV